MIKFRLAPLAFDDLVVEVWKWTRSWGIIIHKGWVRFSTIRSQLNKEEWSIKEDIEKLEKRLAKWGLLYEHYIAEMDEAQDRNRIGFGLSDPQSLPEKDFTEMIGPYCDRPHEDWIEFFNPKIIRKYGLNRKYKPNGYDVSYPNFGNNSNSSNRRAGRQEGSPLMPGHAGNVTAYTLPEMADKAIHIAEESGVGQVVAYREDQNKGGDNKARLKELRFENPKQRGESDNEWNNRLQRILKEEQSNSGR